MRRICDAFATQSQFFFNQTIRDIKGPKILIAHSLGCTIVAEWAKDHCQEIVGALIVAPPDLKSLTDPILITLTKTFLPVNLKPLPFRSTVVASSNDPYAKLDSAKFFAKCWGSKFVNIGDAGHINVDSGYGPWPQGKKYLEELTNR